MAVYGGYGGYNGYAAGSARVLGVTQIERRSSNRLRVRGVATAKPMPATKPYGDNMAADMAVYGGYGYQGGYAPHGELSFRCDIDYRGYITDIDLDRNRYSNYGYRRY